MRAPLGLVADTVRFSWVDGPGNRFVVFLQGCGFNCVACHNPHTIPAASVRAREVSVTQLLDEIRPLEPYLSGLTMSGGEATRQAGFVRELFAAARDDASLSRLTRFIDSNGDTDVGTWQGLAPVTDGVMLDLKALRPDTHRYLTGADNARVLDSIRYLAGAGLLYEVRLLLVPGVNDSPAELRETASWLLAANPSVRVKVNAFRHHGVRAAGRGWPEADCATVDAACEVLRSAGVTGHAATEEPAAASTASGRSSGTTCPQPGRTSTSLSVAWPSQPRRSAPTTPGCSTRRRPSTGEASTTW